ncbi:nucleolar protein 56 [Trichonephila clavipes]|nr:nucleolar protein 56 [Trichonephila clavipes]
MGAEFLFMDDNARPHRANIVDECLQSEDITRTDWPAYSPDLNPIEHGHVYETNILKALPQKIYEMKEDTIRDVNLDAISSIRYTMQSTPAIFNGELGCFHSIEAYVTMS